MLIYNHEKELIGIDEHDLETLGFKNLEELLAESHDFADLFVKKPGYVHNFKHVNWIDFVACADSPQSTKVIIQVKGKSFRSLLEIKTTYLVKDPSSKAFLVYLTNVRTLIDNEGDDNSESFVETPLPITPKVAITPIPTPPKKVIEENLFDKMLIEELIPSSIDLDDFSEVSDDSQLEQNYLKKDLKIDLEVEDTEVKETLQTSMEIFDNGYIFDPSVASGELGLPVELIEEFIGDFIAQAQEFKQDLYSALDAGDEENVKILSHKLKGVAANLRIEDALESLTIINHSSSMTEIKNHMDTFYKIISKLAGEKVQVTRNTAVDTLTSTEELIDDFNEQSNDLDLLDIDEIQDFLPIQTTKSIDYKEEDLDLDIFNIQEPQIKIENDFKIEEIKEDKQSDPDFLKLEEETKVIDYDIDYIAKEIGLSHESFMELLEDYLEEANNFSNSISDAIEERMPQKWKTKAQQLKAMSDNMRVKDLFKDLDILINTEDFSIAQEVNAEIQKLLTEISKIKG